MIKNNVQNGVYCKKFQTQVDHYWLPFIQETLVDEHRPIIVAVYAFTLTYYLLPELI